MLAVTGFLPNMANRLVCLSPSPVLLVEEAGLLRPDTRAGPKEDFVLFFEGGNVDLFLETLANLLRPTLGARDGGDTGACDDDN